MGQTLDCFGKGIEFNQSHCSYNGVFAVKRAISKQKKRKENLYLAKGGKISCMSK